MVTWECSKCKRQLKLDPNGTSRDYWYHQMKGFCDSQEAYITTGDVGKVVGGFCEHDHKVIAVDPYVETELMARPMNNQIETEEFSINASMLQIRKDCIDQCKPDWFKKNHGVSFDISSTLPADMVTLGGKKVAAYRFCVTNVTVMTEEDKQAEAKKQAADNEAALKKDTETAKGLVDDMPPPPATQAVELAKTKK